MKTNTILIASLILCITILLSLRIFEGFATQPADDLTYDDYIKLFILAKRVTEIENESFKIGLTSLPNSNTPRQEMLNIISLISTKTQLKELQDVLYEMYKNQICPNINVLQKELELINVKIKTADAKNKSTLDDIKASLEKKLAILNNPIADNYKAMCSVEIPLLI